MIEFLLVGAVLGLLGKKKAMSAVSSVVLSSWKRKIRTKRNAAGTTSIDGVVPVSPAKLAELEGLPLPVYALARVITSEHGSDPDVVQIGVGWAVINYARGAGKGATLGDKVVYVITRAVRSGKVRPGIDGFFGDQNQGRYVASIQDPSPKSVAIAAGVLSGKIPDWTKGARQFDSPQAFGKQAGTTKEMAEKTAVARRKAGNVMVLAPGIAEDRVRFWRPEKTRIA